MLKQRSRMKCERRHQHEPNRSVHQNAEACCDEIAVGFEDIPFELADSVTTLSFVDGSKFERTLDECVRMSEVDIFTKREEFVLISVGFR